MRRFPLAAPTGLALLLRRDPATADDPATTPWVPPAARGTGRGDAFGCASSARQTDVGASSGLAGTEAYALARAKAVRLGGPR